MPLGISVPLAKDSVKFACCISYCGCKDITVLRESCSMDKLYLGQENEKDVDDLLAQINDESILKMSVNTHKGTDGMQTPSFEDQKLGKEGIDPDLEARYASLKAPRPIVKERGTTAGKSKQHGDIPKSDVSSPKRSSKGVSAVARSNSADSDGGDSLDAELLARLQALKGPSVALQVVLLVLSLRTVLFVRKGMLIFL